MLFHMNVILHHLKESQFVSVFVNLDKSSVPTRFNCTSDSSESTEPAFERLLLYVQVSLFPDVLTLMIACSLCKNDLHGLHVSSTIP